MARLSVEVFDTPALRSNGMMNRTTLPENSGGLFVFDYADHWSFWMQSTPLPLSIAWVNDDNTIVEIQDMEPNTRTSHSPEFPASLAIEVNQGWFERNGVKVGDGIIRAEDIIEFVPAKTAQADSIRVVETWGDAVGQEYHGKLEAFIGDQSVGYLDYAYYAGVNAVKYIEVDEAYRRQGVGTALVNHLRKDGGKVEVLGDVMTTEGIAHWNAINKTARLMPKEILDPVMQDWVFTGRMLSVEPKMVEFYEKYGEPYTVTLWRGISQRLAEAIAKAGVGGEIRIGGVDSFTGSYDTAWGFGQQESTDYATSVVLRLVNPKKALYVNHSEHSYPHEKEYLIGGTLRIKKVSKDGKNPNDIIIDVEQVGTQSHPIAKTADSNCYLHPDTWEDRRGRCYELSAQEVVFGSLDGCKLVHGSIQGNGKPRIGHAWVIRPNGMVYDPVIDREYEPDYHKVFFNTKVDAVYTKFEAEGFLIRTENYGPWGKTAASDEAVMTVDRGGDMIDYVHLTVDGENVAFMEFANSDSARFGRISVPTILNIVVEPEFRRRGYGQRLVDYAKEQARQRGFDYLILQGVKNSTEAHELGHAFLRKNPQWLGDFRDRLVDGMLSVPEEREQEILRESKWRWDALKDKPFEMQKELFCDALAELVSGVTSLHALDGYGKYVDIADQWLVNYIYEKHAQNPQTVHDTTEKDKGGTWSIPEGEAYNGKGFGVSRPSKNESIPLEDWTVERAEEEIDERDDDPSAWLGTWLDDRGTDSSGDDVVYVDQTEIHDTVDVAEQKAKENDQLAYYDFGAGKEVRVAWSLYDRINDLSEEPQIAQDISDWTAHPPRKTEEVRRRMAEWYTKHAAPYDYDAPLFRNVPDRLGNVILEEGVGKVITIGGVEGWIKGNLYRANEFGGRVTLRMKHPKKTLPISDYSDIPAESEHVVGGVLKVVGFHRNQTRMEGGILVDVEHVSDAVQNVGMRTARTILEEIIESDGSVGCRIVSVSASEFPSRQQWNASCAGSYNERDIEYYSFIYQPSSRQYVLDESDPLHDHSRFEDLYTNDTVKVRVWIKGYGYRLEIISAIGCYQGFSQSIAKKVCDDMERKGWVTLADKVNLDSSTSTVAELLMGGAVLGKTARFAKYDFDFCVWSDSYGAESVKEEALQQMGDAADTASVIVGIGDYNKTPTPENLAATRKAFDNAFGEEGWLSTPGNHETEYVNDKPDNLDWYFEHLGWGKVDGSSEELAWAVIDECLFVLFNTAFKETNEQALQDLALQLAAHGDVKRKFVFTHVPIIDPIPAQENDEDHGLPSKQADEFMRICEQNGVDVVFCSHSHGYETWTRGGVLYVITAGVGSKLDEEEEEYHYVRVYVGEAIRVERVPLFPTEPQKAS